MVAHSFFCCCFLNSGIVGKIGCKIYSKDSGACNAWVGKQDRRDFTICWPIHFNFQCAAFLCGSNEFYKARNKKRICYLFLYSALGTEIDGWTGKNYSSF